MKDERGEEGRPEDLWTRTKRFGLKIIKVSGQVSKSYEGMSLSRQMLRSGRSVGAQYRESCRARSNAEFISKLESLLQELDETAYWLGLLIESKILDSPSTRE